MAKRASAAFRNLHNWKTLEVGSTWYVLGKEDKIKLEELILLFEDNALDDKASIDLEIATGKDGEGTGQFEGVIAEFAVQKLSSKRTTAKRLRRM